MVYILRPKRQKNKNIHSLKSDHMDNSKKLLIQLLALTVAASAFGFLLGVAYMMLNK